MDKQQTAGEWTIKQNPSRCAKVIPAPMTDILAHTYLQSFSARSDALLLLPALPPVPPPPHVQKRRCTNSCQKWAEGALYNRPYNATATVLLRRTERHMRHMRYMRVIRA